MKAIISDYLAQATRNRLVFCHEQIEGLTFVNVGKALAESLVKQDLRSPMIAYMAEEVLGEILSSTKEDDTSLEVTIALSAITPTVEKESIHIDDLLKECADFEDAGHEIESYLIQTVEGIYTFECKDKVKADFELFVTDIVKGRILNIKETFVNHPTTKYTTFTRILDDYLYIEMHFHNGETL